MKFFDSFREKIFLCEKIFFGCLILVLLMIDDPEQVITIYENLWKSMKIWKFLIRKKNPKKVGKCQIWNSFASNLGAMHKLSTLITNAKSIDIDDIDVHLGHLTGKKILESHWFSLIFIDFHGFSWVLLWCVMVTQSSVTAMPVRLYVSSATVLDEPNACGGASDDQPSETTVRSAHAVRRCPNGKLGVS